MEKRKVRKCMVCDKEFFGTHSGERGNKVCSEECRRKRISESKMKGSYVNCIFCKNDFWARPSRIKKGVKYCSQKCSTEHRESLKIKKTCKHCGKEYKVTQALSYSTYCSKECHNKGQINRLLVPCAICGTEVERIPSQLKRNTNGKALCSDECVKKYFLTRIVFYQKHTNTKPERMFNESTPDFINQTSDGKFFINFNNGKVKNPDFIVRPISQTKKVIEIFGRYWHKAEEEAELIALYKEVGYDCLVLWEEEVYNDTFHDKLHTFLTGCAVLIRNS